MLIGFGCTVPGLLATRTLESRRDRLTTMLVLPLFSCSARLPIYALILGAFFPQRTVFSLFGVADVTNQALILTGMYLIGIVLAVAAAKVLRSTVLRGEASSFVMELPPYRLPTVRGALVHTWERTWMFLRKAGTVILAAVVVLWALSTFPRAADDPALPAQRARADREFLQAAEAVGPEAAPRGQVSQFLRARMELAAAAGRHWPRSEAFAAARAEYDRKVQALAGADPGTRRLLQDFARHQGRRGQAASAPAPPEPAAALLASAETRNGGWSTPSSAGSAGPSSRS
jgi:ferrous iron transport protein B